MVVVGEGGVRLLPTGGSSQISTMLGGIDPHCLCGRGADLYVPLSNQFFFEAKLVEHSVVEQAACTLLK